MCRPYETESRPGGRLLVGVTYSRHELARVRFQCKREVSLPLLNLTLTWLERIRFEHISPWNQGDEYDYH